MAPLCQAVPLSPRWCNRVAGIQIGSKECLGSDDRGTWLPNFLVEAVPPGEDQIWEVIPRPQ